MRSPLSIICTTSDAERLLSVGTCPCPGPYHYCLSCIRLLMNRHRRIPGRRVGMAVGAEDGDNRDGSSLPRAAGGFEKRYDAGNWSALTAAHHAGVDRNRRRTCLRRHRAGPSESRTQEPGASSEIARTYDCWTGASPVCIRLGRGSQSRCQLTLRGYGSARPCQTRTRRYVDPLLQNRKILQGHGRVGRDNPNSPDGPLDTKTMSYNVWGFVVKRQMFMTLGMGDTASGRSHLVICWRLDIPLGDGVGK